MGFRGVMGSETLAGADSCERGDAGVILARIGLICAVLGREVRGGNILDGQSLKLW
jgi:hypothetical protein